MAKTVTHDENGNTKWGEQDHLEVSQHRSFASMVFELLSEKVPSKVEETIFELILNLSIDHGSDTPSAQATIEAAKEGKTISDAVAAGVTEINDVHGGAQEQLMEILYRIQSSEFRVQNLVEEFLKEGKRIPGFGHRIYKEKDPRAELILEKMKEAVMGEEFIKIALELKNELENQAGKSLPLNIDGVISVALCSFGWDPKLGKAVFIIARTPGLCGQFLNNQKI